MRDNETDDHLGETVEEFTVRAKVEDDALMKRMRELEEAEQSRKRGRWVRRGFTVVLMAILGG